MSRTRLHTELSKILAEVEHEINEHPIREKLKIWKWIVYCYLTNNKIINKIKTENKMNVNIENFEKAVDYNAVSGWHAAFKRRLEEAKRNKQQTKNKQHEKS